MKICCTHCAPPTNGNTIPILFSINHFCATRKPDRSFVNFFCARISYALRIAIIIVCVCVVCFFCLTTGLGRHERLPFICVVHKTRV